MKIPIVDIFAGPGGLGEGFSSLNDGKAFDIRLSIEKETNAHKTLELRSFVRQFARDKIPEEYYEVMREPDMAIRELRKEELFNLYPKQCDNAKREAWQCELGHEDFPHALVNLRIREAIGGTKDWVLIGGPPCQAYSLVGRSRRQWKENLDRLDVRVHLYKEYLRIIAEHHPAVFVMENVKGLLSSKVDGEKIFELIKRDLAKPDSVFPGLSSPEYKIYSLVVEPIGFTSKGQPIYEKDTDYLIRTENYGIPQKRHRVILLGIRADIDVEPRILRRSQQKVTLKEVIKDLPRLRSGINRSFVRSQKVIVNGKLKKKRYYRNEEDSDERWRNIVGRFRTEIISWNGFAANLAEKSIRIPRKGIGSEFVRCETPKPGNPLRDWYLDGRIGGAANHESRSHLVEDLKRYLFSSMFTQTYRRFPRLQEFTVHGKALLPDHENAKSGKFADRFRVQLPDEPATTVTSHISKDGHYFIHYDPGQCRSLTVREAARVQTFPDNYLFCGSRTAQYHQVGNAVPPYLARQIGEVVLGVFQKLYKQIS